MSSIDESMVTGESACGQTVGDAVIGSIINNSGTLVFRAEKLVQRLFGSQIVGRKLRQVVRRFRT